LQEEIHRVLLRVGHSTIICAGAGSVGDLAARIDRPCYELGTAAGLVAAAYCVVKKTGQNCGIVVICQSGFCRFKSRQFAWSVLSSQVDYIWQGGEAAEQLVPAVSKYVKHFICTSVLLCLLAATSALALAPTTQHPLMHP
jgi:hypothetical protein